MKDRKLIVNSNCYHGYSIEEAIDGTRRAGFKNIELTATKGWTEHVFVSNSFSRLLRVSHLLEKNNLEVPAISGHCNLMDRERLSDFRDNIELGHFFGAKIIVSSVGEAHLKDNAEAGDDELVDNLLSLLPLLDRVDMSLVLETHGEHATATRLKSIVSRLPRERFGICYDTANVIFYGNVEGDEDLLSAISYIDYVHIKDKKGKNNEWNFPPLGEGYVDFPLLLSDLDRNGNNSPLSVEIEFTQKGPKDLNEVDRAVEKSARYLESLGYKL